jgi:hypothetical protein
VCYAYIDGMTKQDMIIAELMDALDLIAHEAEKADASRHYIAGVCGGAMKRCNAERERNSDGYLVVRT